MPRRLRYFQTSLLVVFFLLSILAVPWCWGEVKTVEPPVFPPGFKSLQELDSYLAAIPDENRDGMPERHAQVLYKYLADLNSPPDQRERIMNWILGNLYGSSSWLAYYFALIPAMELLEKERADKDQVTRKLLDTLIANHWSDSPVIRAAGLPYLASSRGRGDTIYSIFVNSVSDSLPVWTTAHRHFAALLRSNRSASLDEIVRIFSGVKWPGMARARFRWALLAKTMVATLQDPAAEKFLKTERIEMLLSDTNARVREAGFALLHDVLMYTSITPDIWAQWQPHFMRALDDRSRKVRNIAGQGLDSIPPPGLREPIRSASPADEESTPRAVSPKPSRRQAPKANEENANPDVTDATENYFVDLRRLYRRVQAMAGDLGRSSGDDRIMAWNKIYREAMKDSILCRAVYRYGDIVQPKVLKEILDGHLKAGADDRALAGVASSATPSVRIAALLELQYKFRPLLLKREAADSAYRAFEISAESPDAAVRCVAVQGLLRIAEPYWRNDLKALRDEPSVDEALSAKAWDYLRRHADSLMEFIPVEMHIPFFVDAALDREVRTRIFMNAANHAVRAGNTELLEQLTPHASSETWPGRLFVAGIMTKLRLSPADVRPFESLFLIGISNRRFVPQEDWDSALQRFRETVYEPRMDDRLFYGAIERFTEILRSGELSEPEQDRMLDILLEQHRRAPTRRGLLDRLAEIYADGRFPRMVRRLDPYFRSLLENPQSPDRSGALWELMCALDESPAPPWLLEIVIRGVQDPVPGFRINCYRYLMDHAPEMESVPDDVVEASIKDMLHHEDGAAEWSRRWVETVLRKKRLTSKQQQRLFDALIFKGNIGNAGPDVDDEEWNFFSGLLRAGVSDTVAMESIVRKIMAKETDWMPESERSLAARLFALFTENNFPLRWELKEYLRSHAAYETESW